MPLALSADEATVTAFARARSREMRLVAAVSLPIAVIIVCIDYRLMLLSFIALAPLLVSIVETTRASEVARNGRIRLELRVNEVLVATDREQVSIPHGQIPAVRVTPDAMIVAHAMIPSGFRLWTIPGPRDVITPIANELARQGVRVNIERGLVTAIIGILVGVLVYRGLLVVGSVLVLAALANIGLVLSGRGGSIAMGLALLAGAFAVMVIAALIKGLLRGSETTVRAS